MGRFPVKPFICLTDRVYYVTGHHNGYAAAVSIRHGIRHPAGTQVRLPLNLFSLPFFFKSYDWLDPVLSGETGRGSPSSWPPKPVQGDGQAFLLGIAVTWTCVRLSTSPRTHVQNAS